MISTLTIASEGKEGAMYLRPQTLNSAVEALARHGGLIMAGGTDVFPAHVGRPLPSNVIDVTRIEELRAITRDGDHFRFGGAVRWTEFLKADLPPMFDGLKAAAREIGGVQIQNRGTIAGNLCNASPAADSIPPLLALDAAVELASLRGMRRLALEDFLTGYRSTAKASDEILSAVFVPAAPAPSRSAFLKLGSRRYLVISIVMAAAVLRLADDQKIVDLRIALGAASPVARRLRALEKDLLGLDRDEVSAFDIEVRHLAPLSPIDDVRATASYRCDAAAALIRRTVVSAMDQGHA
jgi:CO/xanthine dehydrogenase FAD-binding subunit